MSNLTPAARAAAWNEQYPVGTAVRYWPGRRDGESRVAETRTPAWPIPSGSALVSITGQSGGVNLTHVEPLHTEAELRERVTRELAASTLTESTPLAEYRAEVEAEVREQIAREIKAITDDPHKVLLASMDPADRHLLLTALADGEMTPEAAYGIGARYVREAATLIARGGDSGE